MKKPLSALVALVAVTLALASFHGSGASAGSAAQAPPKAAPTLPEIDATALAAASAYREPAPTEITEASSTLGQAAPVFDPQDGQAGVPRIIDPRTGRPWAESPVYVVTLHGHFVDTGPAPSGVPVPTGTALTLAIDAESGFVVARSLSSSNPDLQKLNTVVRRLGQ